MCFLNSKIKSDEQCPCGSGNLYKECCREKKLNINLSKKPPEVQIMEKMRASMKKCCMHPDQAHCKGKIKHAHALQNNKIISLLADSERHVYMMNPKKQPLLIPLENGEVVPIIEVSKISANDATTETCFCDVHDNIAFAAIEKGAPDFDETNEEMKFVYAYKAFIFEYYKQRIAYEIFQKCFKENPPAFQSPGMVGIYRMLQLKMKEFEPVKHHFDTEILAKTFYGISTCVVKIPERIKFADYAYIAPDYDMDGNKIKHTIKGIMHRVAITIFPEDTKSCLLLSCLESEKHIYEKLFYQLETAPLDKLKFYLNMVLPLYSENMVLGPSLWSAWSDEVQMAYTYYANLHGLQAYTMGMGIGFGLKNAACDKTNNSYGTASKMDLFA